MKSHARVVIIRGSSLGVNLAYLMSRSRNTGCEMRFVSIDEASEISPVTSFCSNPTSLLYTPDDGHVDSASVYESLQRAGEEHGLRDFGAQAQNSLGMEKNYPAYGHEFIGVKTIGEKPQTGTSIKLTYLAFDGDIPDKVFDNEPVWVGGGISSGTAEDGYSHHVGRNLAFAYPKPQHYTAADQFSNV